ncbi:MAG: TonB-dependent receptor plug domain-containing protein [Balneolaceae bacterium]
MKLHIYIVSIAILIMGAGCASSGSTSDQTSQPRSTHSSEDNRPDGAIVDEYQFGIELSDYLRRVPGVLVRGSGNNVSVNVRGSSSFMATNEPLFVLDGQPIGRSYSEVRNMVNVRDIDYVQVLKGSDASSYGVRGGNGVVMIVTKK